MKKTRVIKTSLADEPFEDSQISKLLTRFLPQILRPKRKVLNNDPKLKFENLFPGISLTQLYLDYYFCYYFCYFYIYYDYSTNYLKKAELSLN